jgi:hypothetical protein
MGKPLPNRYYQTGGEEPYAGEENRGEERLDLSDESQKLLHALDKRMKAGCRESCIFPTFAHPHAGHLAGAIREVGEGDMSRGIDDGRDLCKRTKGFFETLDRSKSTVLNTILKLVVGAVLALIAVGFWQKIQGG